MSTPLRMGLSALVLSGACAVGVPAFAASASAAADATSTVAGTAVPAGATAVGAVAGSEQMTVQVWLKPDIAGATQFANAVSTPGSPSYHQYLSPNAYTARFGPSTSEASDVAAWLTSTGMTAVTTSPQRDYVSATGSVSTINQAFGVQMDQYQTTGSNGKPVSFQSNDTDLSVPSSIDGDVLSVTGLNTTPPAADVASAPAPTTSSTATSSTCSTFWAQNLATLSQPFHGATQLPTPICGYSADQLRGVYGLSAADTGAGETIALIEDNVEPSGLKILTDYASANGLPAPKPGQFTQENIGNDTCGTSSPTEANLDSEAAYAMAPGADQLMVDGDSCASSHTKINSEVQSLFDADSAVLAGNGTKPQASIVSNSWDFGPETMPSIYPTTAHAIDLRAAAEGVGMYFAAGDHPGVTGPASDPFSTAVGGTSLGIGAQDNRVFETGWSTALSIPTGSSTRGTGGTIANGTGGGTSLLYDQPSYQAGVVPASMSRVPSNGNLDRAVPDIAADADPVTGFLGVELEAVPPSTTPTFTTFIGNGTSLATPLIAATVADAQQGQSASFGFINPLLYSLAGTNAFNDVLPERAPATPADDKGAADVTFPEPGVAWVFDAQNLSTSQVTAPGYDTMTGLGTPNGTAFINALRNGR